jgi:hypothetical protein
MPGHSRSKNGVASLAYVPGIHVLYKRHSGQTMASDTKTTKADPAPKSEAAPAKAAPAKDKSTSGETAAKTESSETAAAAPSGYSRGEGQKPVSAAYRENWNAIFAKRSAKRKKR